MAVNQAGKNYSADNTLEDVLRSPSRQSAADLQTVTLVLLGKTGSGKSSLGNAILNLNGNDAFTVTDGFVPTPVYTAVAREARVHDRQVKVVDTPGLMDTTPDGEEKVLDGICDAISRCCEGVDAFLIVMRLNCRLTGEEWRTVNKLEELFGEQFWSQAIVVFTHGDWVDNDKSRFENHLAETSAEMPQLQSLLSKLRTQPLLADASRKRQQIVAASQSRKLLQAVDTLRADSNRKYTNYVFASVKSSQLDRSADLEKQLRESTQENLTLRRKIAQLEADKKDVASKSASFSKDIQALVQKIDATEREVKNIGVQLAKRRCSIL